MSIEAKFTLRRGDFHLDVDLNLPGAGVTAIFGPSGSGKTTLLRTIAGLERTPHGYLKIGDDLWQGEGRFLPPHKRPLGYVFQEPSLFDHLDVRRNVLYGYRRLPESERRVQLQDAIELLDIGRLLDSRPWQLSGGEQQRVAIARALAVSPAMLLMDEPLAALDEQRKLEIMPYLESLHRELAIPVLYVSHSRAEVNRLADYLVLLDNGRVGSAGPAEQQLQQLGQSLCGEPGHAASFEAVVSGKDAVYELTELSFAGGRLLVNQPNLAQQARVQVLIQAHDISVKLESAGATSVLNVLPASIERLSGKGSGLSTLRLRIGETTLVACVHRKAVESMGLHQGQQVFVEIRQISITQVQGAT